MNVNKCNCGVNCGCGNEVFQKYLDAINNNGYNNLMEDFKEK